MNLEKYKWKSRILLVVTPNFKDKSYQKAKKIYQSKIKEFHKRNVKLICKSNKNKTGVILTPPPLSPELSSYFVYVLCTYFSFCTLTLLPTLWIWCVI